MKHKVLLLVDLNNALKRAIFSHRGLTSGRTFTGGVYGLLTGMAKVMRTHSVTHAVLCQDSRPYRRSEEYPEYKGDRKRAEDTDEDLMRAVTQTRRLALEVAEVLGLPSWKLQGFEADDLIARACERECYRYSRIVIWSNDTDLFQLLRRPHIHIDRKDEVMTQAKLLAEHELTPEQHLLLSAFQGSHNAVSGLPGVAGVTARKMLRMGDYTKHPKYDRKIVERNLHLMRLPHPEFPKHERMPLQTERFDARAFYRWVARYDIRATQQMLDAFENLCIATR